MTDKTEADWLDRHAESQCQTDAAIALRSQAERIEVLEAEVEALRVDAERWRYINTINNIWRREEDATLLCVVLPLGTDLSCRASRNAAIDSARKGDE